MGGAPLDAFTSQAHERPMLSLDNTYDHDDLKEWFDRVLRSLGDDDSSQRASGSLFEVEDVSSATVALEPKVDGVAVSLRWEQGNWCGP